jgi:hypothetical protein
MRTIVPDPLPGRSELSSPGLRSVGLWSAGLWSVRLAGAGSASPAIELYAAGVLIDVVSATPVAPQLLRGARAVTLGPVQCALAWGRQPGPGAAVVAEFSRGRLRRQARPAAVVQVAPWCWLAVAGGRFTRVDVQAGPRRAGLRLARGRSCR